jgi:coenzyme PQQ precursor peptide PqqA
MLPQSNGTLLAQLPLTAWLAQPTPCTCAIAQPISNQRRRIMTWSKPEFIDWRFGFEITLYIANR